MSTQPVIEGTVLPPQVSEEQVNAIEVKRNLLLERAERLIICDPASEEVGWALINGIADLKKAIEQDFKDSKAAAHKAWKAICSQESGHLDKLKEPDQIVRGKLSAYAAEKQRIQAEEDRKARESAEAERKRLQAEADERARQEQERLRKEAEDKRIAEALEAEAAGKKDVAEAILNKPVEVAPVVAPIVATPAFVAPAIASTKVEGAGAMVEKWVFTIDNEALIPREYMVIDESAIQKVVDALKGKTRIPGITVSSKLVPRTSGRR